MSSPEQTDAHKPPLLHWSTSSLHATNFSGISTRCLQKFLLSILWQLQFKSLWKFNWSCARWIHCQLPILSAKQWVYYQDKKQILPYSSSQEGEMPRMTIELPHSDRRKHQFAPVYHLIAEPTHKIQSITYKKNPIKLTIIDRTSAAHN